MINFNITGKDRKALVQALSELTYSDPEYAGAPTFAYKVGDYTVDKNGVISYPDTVAPEAVTLLMQKLAERGFTPAEAVDEAPAPEAATSPDVPTGTETDAEPADDATEATTGAETPDMGLDSQPAEAEPVEQKTPGENDTNLVITVPRTTLPGDALSRLKQIVANKEELFKRALSAEALPIVVTEEDVSFPWFPLTGKEGEAAAFAQFITHLCQMAREQTRILDKPYEGDNDRFAMRIFMVRLGMKGAEFALARKLMMKNLSGNSGWRYGAPPKKEAPTPDPVPEAEDKEETAEAKPDAPADGATEAAVPDAEVGDESV